MRNYNRMKRKKHPRAIRFLSKGKLARGCGFSCVVCHPANFRKRDAQDRAAIRHMDGEE